MIDPAQAISIHGVTRAGLGLHRSSCSSSTLFFIHRIEPGSQPLCDLLGEIMCPEMHEKQIGRVMKQMIMKGRYPDPMFCQCLSH